jgi:hypothetical protein
VHRYGEFIEHDRHLRALSHLVEHGGHAATGGVPQRVHRAADGVEQVADQSGHGRSVRADVRFEVEFPAGQHDGDAVVPDRARHQHDVAGPCLVGAESQRPFQDADSGRVHVAAVCLAALHDLGVPGHDLHPGLACRQCHGRDDPLQVLDRQALLEDESAGQVERPGTGDGEVVDRAVHGQVADVAAGEEQRVDHVRVGGEGQPRAARLDRGLVFEPVEHRVAEGFEEDRLDQRVRGLAARAVGERDPALGDPGRAPPRPVDPVEHLLLPGVGRGARSLCSHVRVASWTRSRVNRPKL